jgi:Skp family chaperone for outer membrane proteins
MQADMQYVMGKIQESKKQLLGKLMYDMNVKAMKVVKELIDSEGIGMLLNANPEVILHADTSFDITAKVTERLNKEK